VVLNTVLCIEIQFFIVAQRRRRHPDPHRGEGGPPRPGAVPVRLWLRCRRLERGRPLPAAPGGQERTQGDNFPPQRIRTNFRVTLILF
jgi:hypothetical protein